MADEQRSGGAAAALLTLLDDLATQVVIDGITASVPAMLKQLSEAAQASGFLETATDALLLAGQVRPAPEEAEQEMQANLRDGLAALLKVLNRESQAGAGLSQLAAAQPVANSLASDPELVGDFITEAREHLTSIEKQMLVLEQTPDAKDAIHAVFRGFHTIKGLAGFLELQAIQEAAHEVETLLDLARNGKVKVGPKLVDVVLESADYLKASILNMEAQINGGEQKALGDRAALIARIRAVASGESDVEARPAPAQASKAPEPEPARMGEAFTIRIETNKLDRLMDAVGELMVAQSTIRHALASAAGNNSQLNGVLTRLSRITADVQRSAMSMRMVPVGQLFGRSARMVRDLSRKLGKSVRYESSGESNEVDKTIAEELSDPLLHMVRNAIDHGIETPQEREAAGKDPVARVRLAAYHKGAEIVIEISDDGKGLDRNRILTKAIEKGLVAPDANLSDSEIFALIFEPGFSTASEVTDLSGRGVGMDVVRRNLAKLRGQIDIESKPGEGSTFYLRLPLTLAIIEGLVVVVGTQRFVVPVFAVKEIVRVTAEMISTYRGRHEMALIRGELLPVIRLSDKLGIQSKSQHLSDGLLVITESEGRQFGVWIDDLLGSQEVVIKNLGESFKEVTSIAGCAVLGDGRVGLIVDMAAICRGEQ